MSVWTYLQERRARRKALKGEESFKARLLNEALDEAQKSMDRYYEIRAEKRELRWGNE
jgi:hypothetical protein